MFTAHYKVRGDLSDTCSKDVVLSRIVIKNKEVLQRFLVPLRCVKRVSHNSILFILQQVTSKRQIKEN